MKIVIGLGNPGRRYTNSRHNVGFMALDVYANTHIGKSPFQKTAQWNAEIARAVHGQEIFLLVKPLTYMNLSGETARKALDYYNANPEDMLVVYDELDLPLGTIRARQGGDSAGHNGVRSLIQYCGNEFMRLRIGVANEYADQQPAEQFVLSRFGREEKQRLPDIFDQTNQCIDNFLSGHLEAGTLTIE